ncbi:MAG: NAD(+)/NADH kinase [Candidatus Omnitrophota bacterium]|nr:NAD(+)/NADH kinase [Candidatus Omnitrophota bacterium]
MIPKIKKIGVVVNQRKVGAAKFLPKLRDWLQARDIEVSDTTQDELNAVLKGTSLVICLGGDGTLLSLAGRMKDKNVPVLGVNLGSLGFLTEVKEVECFDELENVLSGKSQIEERLLLSCTVKEKNQESSREYIALNDIVVSREGLTRLLQLEIYVGGEKLTRFSGDGVIVATPTGSTAYSLSAGGAILHPWLEAFIITPICPHASALRSMVVSSEQQVSVRTIMPRDAGKAILTVDGQEKIEIDDSLSVEVTRAATRLQLVKSSKRSYLATLRENFKFPE